MGIILSVNIEYKEEETMDIIKKFGEMVGSTSLKDAKKARKLLLLGYQLQEKRLLLFPDKKLPYSGQYVARIVMQNIIKALSKPEDTAMVSIFVPGELLTAAGLTPYSVETMSCFIAGTQFTGCILDIINKFSVISHDRVNFCKSRDKNKTVLIVPADFIMRIVSRVASGRIMHNRHSAKFIQCRTDP